ncbi:unnamed protein product [Ilex paraguariensis]|uniref:Uncharacterized protein n=1 Tax=Ilex paraguariensis TaxID=185542 RepID=A0ABC8R633_9AQUA
MEDFVFGILNIVTDYKIQSITCFFPFFLFLAPMILLRFFLIGIFSLYSLSFFQLYRPTSIGIRAQPQTQYRFPNSVEIALHFSITKPFRLALCIWFLIITLVYV